MEEEEESKKFDIREIFVDACMRNVIEKVIACCDTFGLDANTVSEDGRSGLAEAAGNNCEDVVAWLLAQPGIQVNMVAGDETALTAACRAGNPDIVRRLVRAPDVDLNWQDSEYDKTAAHWANAACVEMLASVPGVDWNRKDNYGQTPDTSGPGTVQR